MNIENTSLVIFIDGSCEPINPNGTMGIGVVGYAMDDFSFTYADKKQTIPQSKYKSCKRVFGYGFSIKRFQYGYDTTTNNLAEYLALNQAILSFESREQKVAHVFSDSQLVVNQMNDKWNINFDKPYGRMAARCRVKIKQLEKDGKQLFVYWIPREFNVEADKLSKNLN